MSGASQKSSACSWEVPLVSSPAQRCPLECRLGSGTGFWNCRCKAIMVFYRCNIIAGSHCQERRQGQHCVSCFTVTPGANAAFSWVPAAAGCSRGAWSCRYPPRSRAGNVLPFQGMVGRVGAPECSRLSHRGVM